MACHEVFCFQVVSFCHVLLLSLANFYYRVPTFIPRDIHPSTFAATTCNTHTVLIPPCLPADHCPTPLQASQHLQAAPSRPLPPFATPNASNQVNWRSPSYKKASATSAINGSRWRVSRTFRTRSAAAPFILNRLNHGHLR
jgi:hypothetical protein